jgi:uncharacterized protein DUF929
MGGPAQRRHRDGPRVKARWLLAVLAVGVAALAVLGAQLGTGASAPRRDPATGDAIADRLSSLSPAVFHAIGTGSAVSYPLQVDTPPLRDGDRPTVLFMGAEYCPYCAAERWALVLALSRFGRFSGLHLTHSALDDDYPDTQTFTFHGASYRSAYVTFEAVEMTTNRRVGPNYEPLETPTPVQRTLMTTYDGPPYFAPSSTGGIPFIDFGGQYLVAGASYDPAVLHGMTSDAIAAAVSDPSSAVARGVVGSANALTAALCGLTHDAPAEVCTDPAIVAIRPKLR